MIIKKKRKKKKKEEKRSDNFCEIAQVIFFDNDATLINSFLISSENVLLFMWLNKHE